MSTDAKDDAKLDAEHITVVRLGHGGNCSSIGAVVDTLFVGAVVGSALFAAVAASLASEKIELVGENAPKDPPTPNEQENESP